MAFIGVSRCPQCEKRGDDRTGNNLAEYSENFYCWKCGYTQQKKSIENYLKRFNGFSEAKVCNGITLTKRLSTEAKKWLLGYGLTDDEIAQFSYSTERELKGQKVACELLVLLSTTNYWCARNFGDGVKYLSSGTKPYVPYGNNPDVLVFVEDVISAVKVGRVATAVPMLGATVLRDWWQLAKPYKRVIIWGDLDKATDNVIQARKATEILGKQVEYVITPKDPKEYNTKEIINIINI
jgi:ribosomal protein S27AE